MKWYYIDPEFINKDLFGFDEKVYACKVAKWNKKEDIRTYSLKGWKVSVELSEIDPRKEKVLKKSKWFIYACKGV